MQVRNNTITIRITDDEKERLKHLIYKIHWKLGNIYSQSDVIRILIKYADIDKAIENYKNNRIKNND